MKVLNAEIYKQNLDGTISYLDEGKCQAYSVKADMDEKDYVSLNFGKYRIHFNRKEFKEFCKRFVKGEGNVPLLR